MVCLTIDEYEMYDIFNAIYIVGGLSMIYLPSATLRIHNVHVGVFERNL